MKTFTARCVVLLVAILTGVAGLRSTEAATFNVADGDVDALTNAIDSANLAGGTNTVVLATNGVYSVAGVNNFWYGPNGLPAISSTLIIEGNGATIARDTNAAAFRIFYVSGGASNHPAAGNLTLRRVTLVNGQSQGGSAGQLAGGGAGLGGAIFNQGTLVVANSTLTNNTALGGTGGLGSSDPGGGGGLGGNGGSGANGAGGGGGFGGNGANGSNGGGGGGGFMADGGEGSNGGGGGAGFNGAGGEGSNGGGGGGGLDEVGSNGGNDGGAGGGPNGGTGGENLSEDGAEGGDGEPGGVDSGGGGGGLAGFCFTGNPDECNTHGGNGGAGGSNGGGGGGGLGGSGDLSEGGDGGDAGFGGGGGGGGLQLGNGGAGGLGGGGGGGGLAGAGGDGGIGGGGGGAGFAANDPKVAGNGGFGGGAGAGSICDGGNGGFGGGGGSAWIGGNGVGGFGAGDGSPNEMGGGGGGAGIGGAIFNDTDALLTVTNSTITGNTAQGGDGGGSGEGGSGIGGGLFAMDCPSVLDSVITGNAVTGGSGGGGVGDTNLATFVADEIAPVLICLSDIVTDATTNGGAIVEFDAVTATDDCDPAPVVSSSVASGSLFGFGTTIVTNTATDVSGNSTNCTFSVTVLAPQDTLQDVIDDIDDLLDSAPEKPDGKALEAAGKELEKAEESEFWTDEAHPHPKKGKKVFSRLRKAISKLAGLKKKNDAETDDETLDGLIDRLVATARTLAVTAIDDAIEADGDAKQIESAQRSLADGDDADQPSKAVSRYQQAWKKAVKS